MVTGLLLGAVAAKAQVPQLLSCQGRVAVNGTNFTGNGFFEFELVNSNATVTLWSNDGNGGGGNQPVWSVPLPVVNGFYSVLLGDTSLSNMTSIPVTVFTNAEVRLRVWFSNGTLGFQRLTPDQRIAPVGYAMLAATVPDGTVTASKIPPGSIGTAQLALGAVTSGKLAAGSVFPTNLFGGTYVPSGGMILSSNANDGNLFNAGYVKLRPVRFSDGSTMYLYQKP